MKVFVTGHRGYIGVHLVDLLKRNGHQVTGCDLNLFSGCEWEDFVRPDVEIEKDVRNLTLKDLDGHDCVMHLAAISNDPMGELNQQITLGINRDASIEIARLAKETGVPRYLFSGSCSVYGKGVNLELREDDDLLPLTAYAKSKIDTERAVSNLADINFTPVYLRNATAFGHSPMLRIDLVVNNLLASALSYGEIRIMSDGSPWRPLIHCYDIARAFVALMEAPAEKVSDKAINIGANSENYQVKDIADIVQELVPSAKIQYTGEVGSDPRDYRVNFDLLSDTLPDFALEYPLRRGMEELFEKMKEHSFNKTDFEGDQFTRLRVLNRRMDMIEKFQLSA